MYLEAAKPLILKNRPEDLLSYLSLAVDEFNQICQQKSYPKVGVVGEIFLKFNPFAQKDITTWLIDRGIEGGSSLDDRLFHAKLRQYESKPG